MRTESQSLKLAKGRNMPKNILKKVTEVSKLEEYQNQFNSLEKLLENYQTLKLTYEEDISSSPRIAYQQV
jgi:hypothetical protein